MNTFDWIPFYEECADKLVPYRRRQTELINFLEELRARGLVITPLEDMDATGRRFLLTEIDPFTFFGTFNRGIQNNTRIQILEAMKAQFGVSSAVPTDFSGIPILNNMKSWFFAFQNERKPEDIDRLWEVLDLALGNSPLGDRAFAEAFNKALEVRNTNLNLTMGLFWVRPKRFLSLDRRNREYLDIKLPKEGLSFAFYLSALKQVRQQRNYEFAELSYAAWKSTEPPPPPAPDVDYWMVGAYWKGSDPEDQTERFLSEGIWENGYRDRFLDDVKAMKVGDRIAIKATFTQKNNLPFDNRGKTASGMAIKATGTVVKNHDDGRSVEVNWDPEPDQPRQWYFYTGRATVWRLRKDEELARRLIGFTFNNERQDYKLFVEKGESSQREPPTVVAGDSVTIDPYAVEDLIADGVFLSEPEINRALFRWKAKKNLILQGAPGVGKTFVARRLAYALMEERDEKRVRGVQFHPSYSYEDFVRGYRPSSEVGKFELVDGLFLRFCVEASNDPDSVYVLVVEEINRGNLSQIFGELITLLEPDKRGKHNGLKGLYPRSDDEFLYVPENLYVIGTMNIADRSLALVDYALRRRFAFLTLEPRYNDPSFRDWLKNRGMSETLCHRIITRLSALNARISEDRQLGPAFRIGHSFFCPRGKDFSGLDDHWYKDIVDTEIIPLLNEYWYDEPEKAKSAGEQLLG